MNLMVGALVKYALSQPNNRGRRSLQKKSTIRIISWRQNDKRNTLIYISVNPGSVVIKDRCPGGDPRGHLGGEQGHSLYK